jgi:hypothetical protein
MFLLLDAGRPWTLIAAVLFTSMANVNPWRRAYLRGGLDAMLAETPAHGPGGDNRASGPSSAWS